MMSDSMREPDTRAKEVRSGEVCDHPDFCPTLRAVCGRCCGAAAFRHLDETGPDDPDVYATPVTLALGIRAERCDRRGLTRAHTADASAVHTTLRGGEAPMGSRRGPIRHSDATTPSRRQGKVTVAHRFTAHLADKCNYPSFLWDTAPRDDTIHHGTRGSAPASSWELGITLDVQCQRSTPSIC